LSDFKFLFWIVVKFQNDLPLSDDRQSEDFFLDKISWKQFQTEFIAITISPLFTSLNSYEIKKLIDSAKALDKSYQPPNFLAYYMIGVPAENNVKNLLEKLVANKHIEFAYIVNDSMPSNFGANDNGNTLKEYLAPAPVGVDAPYAQKVKGGDGEGNVKFVDIEQGWILDHESINVSTLPCTGINYAFHDHGTAVLGIIAMQNNGKERNGIVPKATGYVVSQWRSNGHLNNADAIMATLAFLEFGDIMLVEAQVSDLSRAKKLWPVEVHTACYDVIRLATALGITVIEPAANGSTHFNVSNDLDHYVLNGKQILNRLNPNFRDSGAIMVAGATAITPHARIYNSNFGNRVDCYAWGESVYTAGNFPNSSDGKVNCYTNKFGGTSSAAAIIAGVAISVQSIMEANYSFRLGPAPMRQILSSKLNGTPSANGHLNDKIGVMPDLKSIIDETIIDVKTIGSRIKLQPPTDVNYYH
jgi:hypothetical protein